MSARSLWTCSVALVVACGTNAPASTTSTAADEAAIQQMANDYTASIEAGDRERFVSFFTDDIVILPPGAPALSGIQAAKDLSGALFDQFTMKESITYDELHVYGDWAAGRFTYTFTTEPKAGGAAATERGKAIVFLQRTEDGSWKFSRWIWNQDHPPAV